ncbi:hypothetical protein [Thalassotalea euphylliae]|uniref:Uncharacterized protein n=1 Tax=Thalassotalea euphylliae TaxID=1655234 RepID=A0A3E0UF10_9GAMM|nr:hypothetical protein [Thalassotalea euphylliae]REL35173.1 hypothetical protein DXX92_07270 [Thalassotalea euphylliae]
MTRARFLNPKYILLIVVISAFIVFACFANEARKEVYFLCGNVNQGTSISSIERQLATITLSSYQIELGDQGKRIVHSSWLNFHSISCTIEFDEQDRATMVAYTSFTR